MTRSYLQDVPAREQIEERLRALWDFPKFTPPHQRVYWHTLGTPQEEDVLVYARPDAPDLGFDPFITDDGCTLVLYVWHGTDVRNRIYYRPLDSDFPAPNADEGGFVRLLDEGEAL